MVHAVQLPGGECRGTLFYINSRDSSRACSAIGEWRSRRRGGEGRVPEDRGGKRIGRFHLERDRERIKNRGARGTKTERERIQERVQGGRVRNDR